MESKLEPLQAEAQEQERYGGTGAHTLQSKSSENEAPGQP